MTEIVSISLENREDLGKEASKKMRKEGYIPAVFYGQEYKDSFRVKVKTSDILKYANSSHWETVRFEVTLPGGKKELCLMREIQRDILNDEILHVDFIQLIKGHKVHVKVPVEPLNREICKGVKTGGVFEQVLHEVSMEVLPREIPDILSYDVRDLEMNQSVHLSDLSVPDSAVLLDDHNLVVFSVSTSRGAMGIPSEETLELEEETTEVEVIGKSKPGEEVEE